MTDWIKEQMEYMKSALRQARRGWGLVSPNPMVGALVVKGKKVLGQGWHTGPGQPHAEVVALGEAGSKAKGADLYVNLEPCNHYGHTGPCSEAILRAGIDRVFYGAPDPNGVASGGAKALAEAGVEVRGGLLAWECFDLNIFFFKWILTKTPFVIMKTAASLDGKTATSTGQSQWISSKAARNFGHHIRAGVDAIIISMPILGTLFLTSLATGLISKAAPQINILTEGFPISITVAFLLIMATMPFMVEAFARVVDAGFRSVETLYTQIGVQIGGGA